MAEAVENTIPCDRCNTPISLNDWSKHIRKCFDKKHHEKKTEEKSYASDNVTNDARIPCEFCENTISLDDYDSHWRKCSQELKKKANQQLKTRISNEFSELFIPCEYCSQPVSAHEFEQHTRRCANGLRHNRIPVEDDDLITIPCEHCGRSISAYEFPFHEDECRRQGSRPASRLDTPSNQALGAHTTWPEHWDASATKNLTRHLLDPNTEEYAFVANNFHRSLPNNQIVQIERIQNRRWYRQYDAHKDDFIERLGNSTEQWLFHGCRQAASADAIMQDCFNRSHAVNCAVGQGIYFATQSAISLGYTSPDPQGLRHMFMARVLVGRTTRGTRSTRVCPPGFDTTGRADVFVTYHDAQAYGQYLITFR